MQDPHPVADARLTRLADNLRPIDRTEERSSGSFFSELGVDAECLDDVFRKDRIDLDDALEAAGRKKRVGQRVGMCRAAEYEAMRRCERTIDQLANSTTVGVQSRSRISEAKPVGGVTNLFFTELNYPITISTGEKELVDFLYQVGSGDSLIRVRDLADDTD